MDNKLFVGNLPYRTSEEDLRQLFSGAGTVTSVSVITDRETGRSKGFAFVEMATQADAEQAIKKFNNYVLDNREIKVDIAKPREERPRQSFGEGGGDRGRRGGPDRRGGSGSGGTRRY